MPEKIIIKGKRIAGIDFGLKRVGIAVCDEMHITVNPREVLLFGTDNFWNNLTGIINSDKVELLVVGYPLRLDDKKDAFREELEIFIEELKDKTGLDVVIFDESFSTKRAKEIMLDIGFRRKKRSKKGNSDKIAAAVILREFLNENS